jgi:hypothetical protein
MLWQKVIKCKSTNKKNQGSKQKARDTTEALDSKEVGFSQLMARDSQWVRP